MAQTDLYSRLKRLFSTNVIVRHVGGKRLKVADTEKAQSIARRYLTDRFTRLYSNVNTGYQSEAAYKQTQRLGLFKDYDSMDADPIISSALDIYADESSMKSEYGKVLAVKTEDHNVHDILNNLFYEILNLEFNLWPWIRNMCKYGDFFLQLEISEEYGIHNVIPLSVFDVTRVEGEDPENPHYVKFVMEAERGSVAQSMSPGETNEFENYEMAHFRLLSDTNFIPYGRSQLEGARKVWKQLMLMEDAMLIHRIMRAPEKRIFSIDIGNIPPGEVDNYMQQIVNKMKKAPVIDKDTGEYNLKYNIQNLTEDFFLPVRGGDSGTGIDTLSGMEYNAIEDIDYLKEKMLAALRIPKAYLGYEEAVGSKATLAAEDVRFARTIERIQRITVSELTKIAIVHLYAQGFRDADLVNFELELTNPSTIYEQEKVELWNSKVTLANDMKDNKMMDTDWIYDNIFNFTQEQKQAVRLGLLTDQKRRFRYDQIEQEGNDPVRSAQAIGTPVDLASIPVAAAEITQGGSARTGRELDLDIPSDGDGIDRKGIGGRPKEGPKYGKDGSARGRDPLGAHDKRKAFAASKKYGVALAHYDSLTTQMDKNVNKKDKQLLAETMDVEAEYKEEVSNNRSDTSNEN